MGTQAYRPEEPMNLFQLAAALGWLLGGALLIVIFLMASGWLLALLQPVLP